MTPVRLEPAALRSRVKHSTTEPLRSHLGVTIVAKNDYCDSIDIVGSAIVDYHCNTIVILLSETFMLV